MHDENLWGYVSIHTRISLEISHRLPLETSRCVNLPWYTLCSNFWRYTANGFTFISKSHNDYRAPSQDTHHHAEVHRISASRAMGGAWTENCRHTHEGQHSVPCHCAEQRCAVSHTHYRVINVFRTVRPGVRFEQDDWIFFSQMYR